MGTCHSHLLSSLKFLLLFHIPGVCLHLQPLPTHLLLDPTRIESLCRSHSSLSEFSIQLPGPALLEASKELSWQRGAG